MMQTAVSSGGASRLHPRGSLRRRGGACAPVVQLAAELTVLFCYVLLLTPHLVRAAVISSLGSWRSCFCASCRPLGFCSCIAVAGRMPPAAWLGFPCERGGCVTIRVFHTPCLGPPT